PTREGETLGRQFGRRATGRLGGDRGTRGRRLGRGATPLPTGEGGALADGEGGGSHSESRVKPAAGHPRRQEALRSGSP
ncbi:MAG: hypothetical protein ACRDJN_25395, partial [Chloroflexota bacterium]